MATWTVSDIGSNSTGSFTFPANTGTTAKSYTVTYNDGNGNTATTSVTVPVCDAEYVFSASPTSHTFPCSGGSYTYTITSQKKIGSTTQAVGCSVMYTPNTISSHSLTQTPTAGTYSLSVTAAKNTGSTAITATIGLKQDETNDEITVDAKIPVCTAKTINNITSSADASGAQIRVYLQSDRPLPVGTSIKCSVMVTYSNTVGESKTQYREITIPEGSSSGSAYISVPSTGSLIINSCCINHVYGKSEDNMYRYIYHTCNS